jgi:hypothetical protein
VIGHHFSFDRDIGSRAADQQDHRDVWVRLARGGALPTQRSKPGGQ